jgi:hypothetical protein
MPVGTVHSLGGMQVVHLAREHTCRKFFRWGRDLP